MADLFERLSAGRQVEKAIADEPGTIPRGPLLQPIVAPTDYKSPPIERLLDWLVNHWTKPTITARDIRRYGPNPLRNRRSATHTAKILAEHGWLTPVATYRRDSHEWRIVRGPLGG